MQKRKKTFEYRQLRQHPKYKDIWEQSYSNELGRLCQGIGHRKEGTKKQRVAGTETFQVIKHGDIPKDRLKEVIYTKVVPLMWNNGKDLKFGATGDAGTSTPMRLSFQVMSLIAPVCRESPHHPSA